MTQSDTRADTEPTRDALREALQEELEYLWYDLLDAMDRAINCTWSIGATGVKHRIQKLTKLVGPTPWENIPMTLLENGTYQQVNAEIGITVNPEERQQ